MRGHIVTINNGKNAESETAVSNGVQNFRCQTLGDDLCQLSKFVRALQCNQRVRDESQASRLAKKNPHFLFADLKLG